MLYLRPRPHPKGLPSGRAKRYPLGRRKMFILEGGERARMLECIDNGTSLGWLINRKDRQVEIYRPGKNVEILDCPKTLSGENILPDFMLDLEPIW